MHLFPLIYPRYYHNVSVLHYYKGHSLLAWLLHNKAFPLSSPTSSFFWGCLKCSKSPATSVVIHAWFTRFLYLDPTSRCTLCGFDTEVLCCLESGGKKDKKKLNRSLFLSSNNPLQSHGCQKLNLQDKGGVCTADMLQLFLDRWMRNKQQQFKRKRTPCKPK